MGENWEQGKEAADGEVHQLLPGVPTGTMVMTAVTGTVEQREHHLGLSSTGSTIPVQIDRTLTFSFLLHVRQMQN